MAGTLAPRLVDVTELHYPFHPKIAAELGVDWEGGDEDEAYGDEDKDEEVEVDNPKENKEDGSISVRVAYVKMSMDEVKRMGQYAAHVSMRAALNNRVSRLYTHVPRRAIRMLPA